MDKNNYTADATDRDLEDDELYAQPEDDDPEGSLFHEIDLHLAPHA